MTSGPSLQVERAQKCPPNNNKRKKVEHKKQTPNWEFCQKYLANPISSKLDRSHVQVKSTLRLLFKYKIGLLDLPSKLLSQITRYLRKVLLIQLFLATGICSMSLAKKSPKCLIFSNCLCLTMSDCPVNSEISVVPPQREPNPFTLWSLCMNMSEQDKI